MRFLEAVELAYGMVKLEKRAFSQVAESPEAFSHGIVITILAGLAAWLNPLGFHLIGLVTKPILALVGLLIGAAVIHVMAMLLGGKGDFMVLLRVMAVGYAVNWLGIVPFLGLLAPLWYAVMIVPALEVVHGLDRGKAIVAVVVPVVVLALLFMMLAGGLLMLASLVGMSWGHNW